MNYDEQNGSEAQARAAFSGSSRCFACASAQVVIRRDFREGRRLVHCGVGGATVTVKSLETGATRSSQPTMLATSKLSLFLLASRSEGGEDGIQTQVRTGIKLEVGQQAVVNLKLEVGDFASK